MVITNNKTMWVLGMFILILSMVTVSADNGVFDHVNHNNNSIFNVSNMTAEVYYFPDGSLVGTGGPGRAGAAPYLFNDSTSIFVNDTFLNDSTLELLSNNNITIYDKLTFFGGGVIDNLIAGWIRVTGNLYATGDINATNYLGHGGNLTQDRIAGSTYSTIQDTFNQVNSAGIGTGGGITNDADGTITVAAGTGYIRATNSDVVNLLYTDWASEAGANVALTDNDMSYIYVEYNSGSPQVIATITQRTDLNTNIFLGSTHRVGTTLHITESTVQKVSDGTLQLIERLKATEPFDRQSGGILSETGTRNIAITAGTWWEGITTFTTASFDSSAAGTFRYYYQNGTGGYTEVASQTQIDNLQYDDGSGTLATLGTAKYNSHWVYVAVDGDEYVIYGTQNDNLNIVQDADAPSSVPAHFADSHARLVGKIIIQKSASTFTSVESAFDIEFTPSVATDHGGLLGLTDDDHTQYGLLAGRSDGQVFIGGTGVADNLTLQSTSGVGVINAGIHFLVGNNGLINAMSLFNNGMARFRGIGNFTGDLYVDNSTRVNDFLYNNTPIDQAYTDGEIANINNTPNIKALGFLKDTGDTGTGEYQFNGGFNVSNGNATLNNNTGSRRCWNVGCESYAWYNGTELIIT